MEYISLAQYFEAPEDYTGCFGWLCGYSADALFLNNACERFKRQTESVRRASGDISLGLLLDPNHEQILPADVPGVLHLPLKHISKRPFRLLHAKVALLGFKHDRKPDTWMVRLLVATGNWTCGTLETSLDLCVAINVNSNSLIVPDNKTVQVCTDIAAAARMMNWLQTFFDTSVLSAETQFKDETNTARLHGQLQQWLKKISIYASGISRFFDNRRQSLQSQLPNLITTFSSAVSRNYLGMGSGFYEGGIDNDVPSVPNGIVNLLQNERLLTQTAEKDLFINSHSCQGIASALPALLEQGWSVREAQGFCGEIGSRRLHAKFIFSGNSRTSNDNCTQFWLYLGSGNLTRPGFTTKASRNAGNLETGFFLTTQGMQWGVDRRNEDYNPMLITHQLPVQWNEDGELTITDRLSRGLDMPEHDSLYLAPPISWLTWYQNDNSEAWLHAQLPTSEIPFTVSGPATPKVHPDARGRIPWPDKMPSQVNVHWLENTEEYIATIPVLDELGRFAATPLPHLRMDDALTQLLCFPDFTDNDEPENPDEMVGPSYLDLIQEQDYDNAPATYPIRTMMVFVENIANRQTLIESCDWMLWCSRLELTLSQIQPDNHILSTSRGLGINPLSPLYNAPFRPDYAENSTSIYGRKYEQILKRIEIKWQVSELFSLGGTQ